MARARGFVMLPFSHVMNTGASSEYATRTAQKAATASAKAPAKAKASMRADEGDLQAEQ